MGLVVLDVPVTCFVVLSGSEAYDTGKGRAHPALTLEGRYAAAAHHLGTRELGFGLFEAKTPGETASVGASAVGGGVPGPTRQVASWSGAGLGE